jgi:hypothetical protein
MVKNAFDDFDINALEDMPENELSESDVEALAVLMESE